MVMEGRRVRIDVKPKMTLWHHKAIKSTSSRHARQHLAFSKLFLSEESLGALGKRLSLFICTVQTLRFLECSEVKE